jgi:hypothetical protein
VVELGVMMELEEMMGVLLGVMVVVTSTLVGVSMGVELLVVVVVLCRGQSGTVGSHSVMVMVLVKVEVRVVVLSSGLVAATMTAEKANSPMEKRILAIAVMISMKDRMWCVFVSV